MKASMSPRFSQNFQRENEIPLYRRKNLPLSLHRKTLSSLFTVEIHSPHLLHYHIQATPTLFFNPLDICRKIILQNFTSMHALDIIPTYFFQKYSLCHCHLSVCHNETRIFLSDQ